MQHYSYVSKRERGGGKSHNKHHPLILNSSQPVNLQTSNYCFLTVPYRVCLTPYSAPALAGRTAVSIPFPSLLISALSALVLEPLLYHDNQKASSQQTNRCRHTPYQRPGRSDEYASKILMISIYVIWPEARVRRSYRFSSNEMRQSKHNCIIG